VFLFYRFAFSGLSRTCAKFVRQTGGYSHCRTLSVKYPVLCTVFIIIPRCHCRSPAALRWRAAEPGQHNHASLRTASALIRPTEYCL